MKKPWTLLIAVLLIVIISAIACACLLSGVGTFSLLSVRSVKTEDVVDPTLTSTATTFITPTHSETETTPSEDILPKLDADTSTPTETLRTLQESIVPINDPIDLARRLEGKQNLPTSLEFPIKTYQVGDQETFWATDSDTNENFQLDATLRYATDHAYFWIEDGVRYNQNHLKSLAESFENEIYPTTRAFFGSEWSPGVDADPHLYILYATGLGKSVAGYFSTEDEYLSPVKEYSNVHEMFFLNADHVDLNSEFAYGVLAHEFQHMIHWYRDRNEQTWMNEGFSDLAMLLNGFSIGGADQSYVNDPDIQLTDWPTDSSQRTPHYGASFLFLTYFLDRFGEEATKALVEDEANGMESIDNVLSYLNATDPLSGEAIGADDVFFDWVIASFLQDENVADGRYTYHNYPDAPKPFYTDDIRSCPLETTTRDVNQYGVDYIRVHCQGNFTLHFDGAQHVGVLPVDPYSASFAFYSNRGDESDMTLTKEFDFTNYSGKLTLTYWTWYDLEEDYDYLYLTASEDGEDWQILTTPSGTPDDPSGNSYGWAYNGQSGNGPEWIQERVDISQFAGERVQFRFEYITDAAVNGQGFLLDDVSIPEIDYFTDFEEDDGGWNADGFVRIQNVLPQTFRLALINIGRNFSVDMIDIAPNNIADIPLQFNSRFDEFILVVSGTTRFTTQKAVYRFSIQP
jgi:hypothetical protein